MKQALLSKTRCQQSRLIKHQDYIQNNRPSCNQGRPKKSLVPVDAESHPEDSPAIDTKTSPNSATSDGGDGNESDDISSNGSSNSSDSGSFSSSYHSRGEKTLTAGKRRRKMTASVKTNHQIAATHDLKRAKPNRRA